MTNTIIKDEKDVLKLKIGTIIKPEDDKRPKNKKDPPKKGGLECCMGKTLR